MSKHTPGPWKIGIQAANAIRIGSADFHIADINLWRQGNHGPVEQNAANATLIAAAPDLLEALKAVVLEFEGWMDWQRKDILKKAFAAIAKAEGDSK